MPYPQPWERSRIIMGALRLSRRGSPEQPPQARTDFRPQSPDDFILIEMGGDQGDKREPWERIQTWAEEGAAEKMDLPGFIRGIGTVPVDRIFPNGPED